MHITQLTATNVKRLVAVAISPEGHVVIVGGKNGQGKSSLLDSIEMALGGGKAICDKPIRSGASRAEVELVLDNGLLICRTFTAKGTALTVKASDGSRLTSPQAILDRLAGSLTFDPLAFTMMAPVKQRETLRALVGLDFTEIDADRKKLYDERTETNREVAFVAARLTDFEVYAEAPDEEISVAALVEKLKGIEQARGSLAEAQALIHAKDAELQGCHSTIEKARNQIAQWQDVMKKAKTRAAQVAEEQEAISTNAANLEKALANGDAIREQITRAEATNEQVRANVARGVVESQHGDLVDVSKKRTAKIEDLDAKKAALLAGANFPVDGLAFDDEGVTFNGVPFPQCSSAEQLRVSVAMGMAANPELKIMLIRNGSLLDGDSMKILAGMAERSDYQIWLERVGDQDDCAIVIEDGTARDAAPRPPTEEEEQTDIEPTPEELPEEL